MRKRITSLLLVMCMVLSLLPTMTISAFAAGGSGTYADPYIITTADELAAINGQSACYKLGADIAIDSNFATIASFSGFLDGDGHKITGMVMTNTKTETSATTTGYLFAKIAEGAYIRNLEIAAPKLVFNYQLGSDTTKINSNVSAAFLAAENRGTVNNVTISDFTLDVGRSFCLYAMAGMIYNNYGTIINSTVSGTMAVSINGYQNAGITYQNNGTIANVTADVDFNVKYSDGYSTSRVSRSALGVGANNGTMYNVWVSGSVTQDANNYGTDISNNNSGYVVGSGGTTNCYYDVTGTVTYMNGTSGGTELAYSDTTYNTNTTNNTANISGLVSRSSGAVAKITADPYTVTITGAVTATGSAGYNGSYTLPTTSVAATKYVLYSVDGGGRKSGYSINGIKNNVSITATAYDKATLTNTVQQTKSAAASDADRAYTLTWATPGTFAYGDNAANTAPTDATVKYKLTTAAASAYTTTVPSAPGTYDVQVTSTDSYYYYANAQEIKSGLVIEKVELADAVADGTIEFDTMGNQNSDRDAAGFTGANVTTVGTKIPTTDFTIEYADATLAEANWVFGTTPFNQNKVKVTVKDTNATYTGSYVLTETYYTTYEPTINVVIAPESPNTYPNTTSITMSIAGNSSALNGYFEYIYGTWKATLHANGAASVTDTPKFSPGVGTSLNISYYPTTDERKNNYWASASKTISYNVNKGTPTKDDLQCSIPGDTTYTYGTSQTASIDKVATSSDLGDITVKYGTSATNTSADAMGNATTTEPTNAGTYYVWADIAGNDYYNAAEVYCGSFTIAKCTPTISVYSTNIKNDGVGAIKYKNIGGAYFQIDVTDAAADNNTIKLYKAGTVEELATATVNNQNFADLNWTPGNVDTYNIEIYIPGNDNYNDSNKLTYTVTVTPIDPKVSDLDFTIPTGDTYNKSAHSIGTVKAKDTVTGLGNVTVKYALKTGETYGEKAENAPINAGTYGVYADIAQGTNYNAATDLFLGDYTIAKATQTITANNMSLENTPHYYGDVVEIEATTDAADDGGTVTCTTTDTDCITINGLYATVVYTGSSDKNAAITVSAGETANYNAAKDVVISPFNVARKTPTVTLAITDADGKAISDATYEDSITLKATVAKNGDGDLPTGTITFILASSTGDGSGDEIGTANLTSPADADESTATLTVDATSANKFYATSYYITAKYTPAENTGYATADLTSGLFRIRQKTISALTFGGTAQTYESGTAKTITVTAPNTLLTNDNFNVAYYLVDENADELASTTPVAKAVAAGKYLCVVTIKDDKTFNYAFSSTSKYTVSDTTLPNDITAYTNATYMLIRASVDAQQKPISFASSAISKKVTDAPFTNTLTNPNGGAGVTYESSNTDVATVDSASGLVTILAEGTATITATSTLSGTTPVYASYTLTVGKQTVTITAINDTVTYGSAWAKAAGVTISDGLKLTDFDGELTYATSYLAGKGVGEYDITPKGLTSDTYNIVFEKGTLTVNPKVLDASSFVFAANSKTYDTTADATGAVTFAADALFTGDSVKPVFSAVFDNATVGKGKTVTFTVDDLTGSKAANYELKGGSVTDATATADISQATIKVVCPANTAASYDGTAKGVNLTATVNGMVFADYDVTYKMGDSAPVSEPTQPGTYTVIVTPTDTTNYTVASFSSTLTIKSSAQESFEITGVPATVTYGDAGFTLKTAGTSAGASVTYASGDTAVAAVDDKTGAVTINKPGTVTITATAKLDGYADRTKTVTFTVQKKAVTVTANNQQLTYGDNANNGYTVGGADETKIGGTAAYTTTYVSGSNVGTYTVSVSGLTSDYYSFNYVSGAITVSPKALTAANFVVNAANKAYDGTTAATLTATVTGLVGNDTLTATATGSFGSPDASDNKDVTYTITGISGAKASNYTLGTISAVAEANIEKATVRIFCAATTTKTYTGEKISVDSSAMVGSVVFTDYTLGYTQGGKEVDPVAVGEYDVIVKLTDSNNYKVEDGFSAKLTITSAAQTIFSIIDVPERVYYGDTFKVATDGTDGTVSYQVTSGPAAIDKDGNVTITGVGAVKITATSSKPGYDDKTASRTFTANKKVITATATAVERPYDGTLGVNVNVTLSGVLTADAAAVSASATGTMSTADAGTSKLVYVTVGAITGSENYTLESSNIQTTVNISKKEITAFTISAQDKTYDGTVAAVAAVDDITGIIKEDAGQVTVLGSAEFASADAGSGTVTFTASGLTGTKASNYAFADGADTATDSATIKRMNIYFTVGSLTFTYDGSEKPVEITAVDEKGNKFNDFTVSYEGGAVPVEADSYDVSVALGDTVNYTSDWTDKTLVISNASQSALTITGLPGTVAFGSTFTLTAVGGDGDGAVTWQSDDSNVSIKDNLDGTADITIDGAVGENVQITATKAASGSYDEISNSVTFMPTKKTVSFILGSLTQVYGSTSDVSVHPSDSNVASGDYDVTYNGSAELPTAVGTYTVLVETTSDSNYNGSATAMLTIKPATMTGISVDMSGWTYGDIANDPTVSGTVPAGVTGTFTYSTLDGTKPKAAGTYTVVLTLTGDNYNTATVSKSFTIAKRTLTVTANDAERGYGETNPDFTVKYEGFVNGEDVTVLQSEPYGTTTATSASIKGEYPIVPKGGRADNYTFNYVNGTLTINASTGGNFYITGANNSASVGDTFTLYAYYGNQIPAVEWSSSDTSVATIDKNGKVTVLKSGATTIKAHITDANYNVSDAEFALTASKRQVNLILSNLVSTYNGQEQSVSFASDNAGFTPEVGKNVTVTYTLTTDSTVTTAKNVGTYSVNYVINDESYTGSGTATMYINKANAELVANNLTKTYGEANPAYKISGIYAGDEAVLDMFSITSDADATGAKTPVGEYPIAIALKDGHSLTENANYNFTIGAVQGKLTVSPKALTVNVSDATRAYGKENPTPAYTITGFENGETEADLTGNFAVTYDTSVTADSAVKTYTDVFEASGLSSANYAISYVYTSGSKGDLTITTLPVAASVTNARTSYITVSLTEAVKGLTSSDFAVKLAGSAVTLSSVTEGTDGKSYTLYGSFTAESTYTIDVSVDTAKYALTGSPLSATIANSSNGGGGGGGGGSVAVESYAVSVSTPSNGTIVLDKKTAEKGATVTVTATADAGYTLGSLTVKDKSGSAIYTVKASDGKYTFTMPSSDVTVSAVFTKGGSETELPFIDVSSRDYFYNPVVWAVKNNITAGTSATTFSPNATCTRAQTVTFLWRAMGSPEPTSKVCTFTDVKSDAYYYKAVLWAVENGITNGITKTTFGPNATVSRAQVVTFQWRAAGSETVSAANPFKDVDANAYYSDAIAWAVSKGITAGTGATTFAPAQDCIRGQIVTFLYRQLGE